MRPIIKSALAIGELAYTLENISQDDRKEISDYADDEILYQAAYVLSLFVDPCETHWNAEDLRGENGEEQQKWARKEVQKLRAFIKKYQPATV
jgi:hypothetical protein